MFFISIKCFNFKDTWKTKPLPIMKCSIHWKSLYYVIKNGIPSCGPSFHPIAKFFVEEKFKITRHTKFDAT